MNNLKDLLFSSYQRTTVIILLAVLGIAIPLPLILVSQQQDIRQRAQTSEEDSSFINPSASGCVPKPKYCEGPLSLIRQDCKNKVWCSVTPTRSLTPTRSPSATATQSPSPRSSPSATSTPAATPTIQQPEFHDVIDFNDDGKIDELDLNILYS